MTKLTIDNVYRDLYNRHQKTIKYTLENIKEFVSILGNPQETYPSIHVTGTNGKGSVSAILEAILAGAGYRTGLLTSPHLVSYNERIRINSSPISDKEIIELYTEIKQMLDINWSRESLPSFFEYTTGLAFEYFKRKKVDIAICEVGLGGRLDATNVLNPVISIITRIALDHTKTLGNSLEEICREKAGIIKQHTPVVFIECKECLSKILMAGAKRKKSEVLNNRYRVGVKSIEQDLDSQQVEITLPSGRFRTKFNLAGRHQLENLTIALKASMFLRERGYNLGDSYISKALSRINWPGRCQVLRRDPPIICDAAHNLEKVVLKPVPDEGIFF